MPMRRGFPKALHHNTADIWKPHREFRSWPNKKAGKPSCHSCGGSCGTGSEGKTDADLVASITKKVMEQLGL